MPVYAGPPPRPNRKRLGPEHEILDGLSDVKPIVKDVKIEVIQEKKSEVKSELYSWAEARQILEENDLLAALAQGKLRLYRMGSAWQSSLVEFYFDRKEIVAVRDEIQSRVGLERSKKHYWTDHQTTEDADHFFDLVFAHCHALGLPIPVVRSHHWLLSHINGTPPIPPWQCDEVWNVDYHSDLGDPDKKGRIELNCGTWGNHVKFRENATFVWCAPDRHCRDEGGGWCHTVRNPFKSNCSGWKRTRSLIGWKRIPWDRVRRVGVAVSPDYFKADPVEGVLRRLKLLKVCRAAQTVQHFKVQCWKPWENFRRRTVSV